MKSMKTIGRAIKIVLQPWKSFTSAGKKIFDRSSLKKINYRVGLVCGAMCPES